MFREVVLLTIVALAFGLPTEDRIVKKLDETRYQPMVADDGSKHLADLWMTESDVQEAARYDADRQNVYHLFTRQNPTVSQPLLMGVDGLIGITNFDARRRTVVLMHGWRGDVTSPINTVLVPAFLSAEDVNVIALDWSAGVGTINYATAVTNTVTAGESLARFLAWLSTATGVSGASFHLVGHSLGAHLAGIAGRNLGGSVGYITALEAAWPGFITNDDKFRSTDAVYTEVIHTNAGVYGYIGDLGDVDFYPNGGIGMPGCDNSECDHSRSYFYFAETLTSGGFTGTRCASYVTAMANSCILLGRLQMGGLVAKTGSSGIYHLETNAAPPFSRG